MGERLSWWKLILGILLVGVGYLFWVQNHLQVATLSLNLGFAAWKTSQSWSVPGLLGVAFLLGLVPMWLWGLLAQTRLQGQIRKLQQELSFQTPPSKNSWQ